MITIKAFDRGLNCKIPKEQVKICEYFKSANAYSVTISDGTNTAKLKPCIKLSTAFCWGRHGLCSSELAYTILRYCYDKKIAELFYTYFRCEVISKLDKNWTLTKKEIDEWITLKKKKDIKKSVMICL